LTIPKIEVTENSFLKVTLLTKFYSLKHVDRRKELLHNKKKIHRVNDRGAVIKSSYPEYVSDEGYGKELPPKLSSRTNELLLGLC
jgi:hypothetical protein